MPRYALIIAYDGSGFRGWQKQEPPSEHAALSGSAAYIDPELVPGQPGRVALRTVQGVVERAVREIVRQPVEVLGASRTDAGVHARGQVAAFTCGGEDSPAPTVSAFGGSLEEPARALPGSGWPVSRGVDTLLRAINGRLPEDVLVRAVARVDPTFDPVSDCVAKAYSYTFHVGTTRPLDDRARVHQVWDALDVERMRAAAARLVGTHDFAAFAAAGHGRLTTVRTVLSCEVSDLGPAPDVGAPVGVPDGVPVDLPTPMSGAEDVPPSVAARVAAQVAGAHLRSEAAPALREGVPSSSRDAVPSNAAPALQSGMYIATPARRVRIDIVGTGFLWHMVRIIAGTLAEAGRARLTPDDVSRVLESCDRQRAGPTVPARGLCLEWIRYRARPAAGPFVIEHS